MEYASLEERWRRFGRSGENRFPMAEELNLNFSVNAFARSPSDSYARVNRLKDSLQPLDGTFDGTQIAFGIEGCVPDCAVKGFQVDGVWIGG